MKQSEIRAKGQVIVETVFAGAIKSDDKEVWKRAIAGARNHLAELEKSAKYEPALIWAWESALRQLADKFGKKFIKKPTNA